MSRSKKEGEPPRAKVIRTCSELHVSEPMYMSDDDEQIPFGSAWWFASRDPPPSPEAPEPEPIERSPSPFVPFFSEGSPSPFVPFFSDDYVETTGDDDDDDDAVVWDWAPYDHFSYEEEPEPIESPHPSLDVAHIEGDHAGGREEIVDLSVEEPAGPETIERRSPSAHVDDDSTAEGADDQLETSLPPRKKARILGGWSNIMREPGFHPSWLRLSTGIIRREDVHQQPAGSEGIEPSPWTPFAHVDDDDDDASVDPSAADRSEDNTPTHGPQRKRGWLELWPTCQD